MFSFHIHCAYICCFLTLFILNLYFMLVYFFSVIVTTTTAIILHFFLCYYVPPAFLLVIVVSFFMFFTYKPTHSEMLQENGTKTKQNQIQPKCVCLIIIVIFFPFYIIFFDFLLSIKFRDKFICQSFHYPSSPFLCSFFINWLVNCWILTKSVRKNYFFLATAKNWDFFIS